LKIPPYIAYLGGFFVGLLPVDGMMMVLYGLRGEIINAE
tara:strand:+ start:2242 stop:2358 length:117 start_codon:yes stop_codon:yes gene_type:complete